jgi:hypothetical protein
MEKLSPKKDKERAFRFASTIFLFAAIVSIIWAVGSFENGVNERGIILTITGIALIGIMVWTFFHPFYPVLLGLSILICLTIMLNKEMDKSTFGLVDQYLFLGNIIAIYALIIGFKEWRFKINKEKNTIDL